MVDNFKTTTGSDTIANDLVVGDDITVWDDLAVGDDLAVTGDLDVTGISTLTWLATLTAGIDGKVIFAGTETIAAGGTTTALSLAKTCHYIDADAGWDVFTLANGTEWQLAVVVCKSATGTCTVTPATMKGGTNVILNAAWDAVTLAYVWAWWSVIGGNWYTIS